MGLDVHQKKIGETTYTINMFPARKANKNLFVLKKVLGPSLMEIMSVDLTKKNDPEQAKKFASALAALGEDMTEDEFDSFCDRMLKDCFIGNTPVSNVVDVQFMGKLEEMYMLIFEVIKVNYSGFLKGLAGLRAQAPAMAASGSESLTT